MRQSHKSQSDSSKKQKKLSGSQKAYDWNRDGKLSTLEWSSWYWNMYGEEEERRRRANRENSVTVPVSVSFSLVYHVDLAESWKELKKAFAALVPSAHNERLPLLSKVLLHEVSAGLRHLNTTPAAQKMQELESFLNGTPELHLEDSTGAVIRSIRANVLYTHEAELSDQFCGTFWSDILSTLRPEQYYGDEPEGLSDLIFELSCIYAYFGGKDGEEMDTSRQRRYALRDAFDLHWQTKLLLHPDVERAKELLARGEFPANEDICRDILVTEYPEEAALYSLEELDDMRWHDLLDDVFSRDSSKAIQMWRTLLDTAAPCLKSNEAAAEGLLHDWDVLDSLTPDTAEAFFCALADDTFANQIFRSAYVWNLQRDLLSACHEFDRTELGQHCLDLVLKNPHLTASWERRLRYALFPAQNRSTAPKRKPPIDELPDDGTVFHYCTVRLQGVRRPYAYLTGDLSLKVGDWVEVPFGKDDIPRRGQVGSVTDCTRLVAPWPPEQTKAVLRVVEAPVESERRAVSSMPESSPEPLPKPVQKKSQTPKPTLKTAVTTPKAAPEPAPATSDEDAEMARLLEEIEAEKEHKSVVLEKPEPLPAAAPKQRFSWKLACGGIVILTCVIAGAVSYRLDIAHYQQAEQYLADNDFQNAAVELSHVPSFYRDQETLARYAQLCLLAESGTEENCKAALDGLETLLAGSGEAMCAQIQPQYERIHKQYNDLLYETALRHLQNKSYTKALNYLRKVPAEYPDTAELLRYAQSRSNAKSSDTSYHLQTVLSSMERIPMDYSGLFAEEISAFRGQLSEMIAASEAREEKIRAEREAAQAAAKKAEEERIAALKASGIPYVGMAERDVNSTRQLGKAAYNDQSSREWVKGADGKYFYDTKQVYAWYSKQNGDMVFKVECKNGVVISAVKYGGDAYWNGDQLLVKLGPQIIHKFNSGGTTNSGSDSSIRDVYDNPEDLYEENRDWFDDEDEAWDYWYED